MKWRLHVAAASDIQITYLRGTNIVYFDNIMYKYHMFFIRPWQYLSYRLQHPYLDNDISIVECVAKFVIGEPVINRILFYIWPNNSVAFKQNN